jgi:hypothetical protein
LAESISGLEVTLEEAVDAPMVRIHYQGTPLAGAILAIGDVTDLDENKMVAFLSSAIKVAVANALALQDNLAAGKTVEYAHYKPKTGDQSMVVSLGKNAGVAQLGPVGPITWSWLMKKLKTGEMFVPRYRGLVGQ